MVIWMKVTKDKYELPIAITDSVGELARVVGTTANCISSSICHGYRTYVKVIVDEKEGENDG